MNTTYLCTLGVSIANRLDREILRDRLKKNLPWDAADPDFEKTLCKSAAAIPVTGPERDSCCAEATILAKMKAVPGDRVRLLATDTCLGRLCGDAVKEVLTRCFGLDSGDVSVVRIEDLQVGDAKRLRETGVKNLLSTVDKYVKEDRNFGFDVCLCPNGGYKGVVPFLTLAGMILHCKVVYTFEHAGSVVVLPPLPFALDADAYLRARDAIAALYDKIEMPETQFLSMVSDWQPEERDRFLGFTEPSGTPGFVTLSPLVEIATSGAENRSAWLSPQAAKDLEKLGNGTSANNCCRIVLRSQDPLYRSKHISVKHGTDLVSISYPRQHTAERVLGYVDGGRFLVCRVFPDHAGYEGFLSQHFMKKDFPPDLFAETKIRMQSEPPAESGEIESWSDLKADRDRLRLDAQNLQNDIARLREELADGQEAIQSARKTRARCEEQGKRIAEITRDLARTRNELDNVRSACDMAIRQTEEEKARSAALQNELESASAELATARARLDAESRLGFFARLRRVFRP